MKTVTIKIGSSIIAPEGKVDSALVTRIVKDICRVESLGFRPVLVSSGAIACGLNILGYRRKPKDMHSLMAISAIGQIALMDVFNAKFKKYNKRCAQILLTWDDFDIRSRFINIRKTLEKLLKIGIIPVINENDVVSYEEIRLGDNDRLSSLVADLIGSDKLIILSDVKGLLKGGRVVQEVKLIDKDIVSLARKEDKVHTSGGMLTKLEAARLATSSGIKTVIAYGRKKNVISDILKGKNIGSVFLSQGKKERARKRWISNKLMRGKLCIDNGAKTALLDRGKSLLNVGVTEVEGPFKKGDAVAVIDEEGNYLGCGLVNYSYEELKGSGRKKLAQEVVHRDNFVKASQGWCYYSHLQNRKADSKG
ncbi:MAG: glutamate 5-kinase [Candidatus Omnitrophica bacterium]|nr:glutamate 5-kinase [Candidatus Omnitrophota bacterium]MBD3268729.1 glutamate 5-kinase [Candidatus Omnitrophota bacterium]